MAALANTPKVVSEPAAAYQSTVPRQAIAFLETAVGKLKEDLEQKPKYLLGKYNEAFLDYCRVRGLLSAISGVPTTSTVSEIVKGLEEFGIKPRRDGSSADKGISSMASVGGKKEAKQAAEVKQIERNLAELVRRRVESWDADAAKVCRSFGLPSPRIFSTVKEAHGPLAERVLTPQELTEWITAFSAEADNWLIGVKTGTKQVRERREATATGKRGDPAVATAEAAALVLSVPTPTSTPTSRADVNLAPPSTARDVVRALLHDPKLVEATLDCARRAGAKSDEEVVANVQKLLTGMTEEAALLLYLADMPPTANMGDAAAATGTLGTIFTAIRSFVAAHSSVSAPNESRPQSGSSRFEQELARHEPLQTLCKEIFELGFDGDVGAAILRFGFVNTDGYVKGDLLTIKRRVEAAIGSSLPPHRTASIPAVVRLLVGTGLLSMHGCFFSIANQSIPSAFLEAMNWLRANPASTE